MNGKSASGTPACIEGLPPLPKSLSGLLNSSGGSWRDMERVYVKKTMIQDDLSRGRANADGLLANKPANLDAALALLRKEMVGLRQQDMSLLCQLWSLHESIQEYKGSCQDLSAGSSADGPYGMENGYFDEDDEYYTESGVTPTETPEGPELSPQNGTAQGKWLHDSLHVTI
ncbi:sprT-like domain-containing protein Spartan [Astyanax mexicanus]|uniref:Protein FAM89A n=2 Tax=Astyanax mexicanus TaxID=7994 RepID=A0A8B9HSB6_ASTMX|nr:sprT-like domain-containing protein Spartan [Astyanax mexicanus]KAG9282379.1 protein FAM89A [Astyanax mexicanus]